MKPIKLILLCLVTLLAGACQNNAQDGDEDLSVFRRGNNAEPATLDPHRAEGLASVRVLSDIYEGLTAEDVNAGVVAGAAQSWQIEDGGLVYRFTLRDGLRWSNGEAVHANDFVAGIRRTVDPSTGSTYAQMLLPIKNAAAIIAGDRPPSDLGVRAPDAKTLIIELNHPTPYFLGLLTNASTFPIYQPGLAEHGDRFARAGNLVSNGPYRLISWQIGSKIIVERNPYYWDAASVAIDRVEYYPIADAGVELNMFRAGELDYTYTVPNSQYKRLRQTYGSEFFVAPYLSTYFLAFDMTEPPFNDVRLRQALTMAIDRDDLVDVVLGTGQAAAWGLVPPGVNNYQPFEYEWSGWPREQQIEKARELYAQAGYSDENPLRIELLYNTGDNHKKNAVAVQGMLRENLGANIVLVNQEWKVMLQTRKDKSAWDLLRFGWNGDYNDAFTFLEIFQAQHGHNPSGFSAPRYDELLALASAELDPSKRSMLLHESETYLMQQYPILPMYFYVAKHLISPRIQGYTQNIMDRSPSKLYRIVDDAPATTP